MKRKKNSIVVPQSAVTIDYKRWWMDDKLQNVARQDSLIQGDWDLISYFRDLRKKLQCFRVLDFGCGTGRLFPSFEEDAGLYYGMDINPYAISQARILYPNYKNRFIEVPVVSKVYPQNCMTLAFTVFLHLDDMMLRRVLASLAPFCRKNFVIVETLGHEWQNPEGIPPCFNRTLEEYIDLMKTVDFRLVREERKSNPHYEQQNRYAERNTDTSVLIFERI